MADQNPSPSNDHADNPKVSFVEAQAHYDSLISLFKYAITGLISLFGIIGFAVGFITYSDSKELKAAIKDQERTLQQSMAAQRASEAEMRNSVLELIKETRTEVSTARQAALDQIDAIKEESTDIARIEAKKRIEQVFETNNLEGFIVQVVKEKLEPEVDSIVNKKILDRELEKFNKAVDDLASTDESKHELAFQYFQNSDPMDWPDEGLKKLIKVLNEKNDALFVKNDVLVYVALCPSPIVKRYFITELAERPSSLASSFAKNYLALRSGSDVISSYVAGYKNTPLSTRAQYYVGIVDIANSKHNEMLALAFLNSRELVDSLFADLKVIKDPKITIGIVKSSMERQMESSPLLSRYKESYFHFIFFSN